MSFFDVLNIIWMWIVVDIFGNKLLAFICIFLYLITLLGSIGLPIELILGFTIPITIFSIIFAVFGWFGWLILLLCGFIFGLMSYRFTTGR